MTDKPDMDVTHSGLGRRGLIRSGAIGGAATLLAAGAVREAVAAVPPVNDTDYPDFSLIKINGFKMVFESGMVLVGKSGDLADRVSIRPENATLPGVDINDTIKRLGGR